MKQQDGSALSHFSEPVSTCALLPSLLSFLSHPHFPALFFLGRVFGKECPQGGFMPSLGLQKLLSVDCFLGDHLWLGDYIYCVAAGGFRQ